MLANLYGNMLHDKVINVFKTEDKHFWVDGKCNNCGTCEKICGVGNIQINSEGKHIWGGNCQSCYGCIQWCPKSAIQYKEDSKTLARNHNNEINLNELLL